MLLLCLFVKQRGNKHLHPEEEHQIEDARSAIFHVPPDKAIKYLNSPFFFHSGTCAKNKVSTNQILDLKSGGVAGVAAVL